MGAKSGPFIADGYVKDSSGNENQIFSSTGALYHQGSILPDTSMLAPIKLMTWPSTTAQTLANTTTVQTFEHKTIGQGCALASAAGTSDAVLPNYGLSIITATTAPFTAVLGAPVAGMQKFIHVAGANTTDLVTVDASTTVEFGVVGTTDGYRKMIFSCKGTVALLGITTARWDVLSIGTTLVGTSTLPTFTT